MDFTLSSEALERDTLAFSHWLFPIQELTPHDPFLHGLLLQGKHSLEFCGKKCSQG